MIWTFILTSLEALFIPATIINNKTCQLLAQTLDDEITTYVGETSSDRTVRGHASALAERASLYADKVNISRGNPATVLISKSKKFSKKLSQ